MCSTISSDSLHVHEPSFKVFVKFPLFVKREDIKDHLKVCGLSDNVKSVRMFFDKAKKPKGSGYVEVIPPNAGRKAISKLNGSLLLGKYKIEAKKFNDNRKRGSPGKKPANKGGRAAAASACIPEEDDSDTESGESFKIFVGSLKSKALPHSIQSAHLQQHFNDFAQSIQNVYVIMDRETKQSKGFGFVTFNSKKAAQAAVNKLNGSQLHGCQLKLDFAKTKKAATGSDADQGKPRREPRRKSSQSTSDAAHLPKKNEQANVQGRVGAPMYRSTASAGVPVVGEVNHPTLGFAESPSHSQEFKVFVGGVGKSTLPESVQPHHLRNHFAQFQVLDAYIAKHKDSNQSKGYGFVVFSSSEEAQRAIKARNGSTLDRCKLKVQHDKSGSWQPVSPIVAQPNPVAFQSPADVAFIPQQPQQPPPIIPTNTVCLCNLSTAIGREEIVSLCGGKIIRLQIDGMDSSDCNKATVTFSSIPEASDTISKLNGKDFLGQTVTASYVHQPNQPQTPFPPQFPIHPQPQVHPQPRGEYMYPVKVTHLAPTVSEEVLQGVFRKAGEIVKCKVFSTASPYALVNFKQDYQASSAVHMFHGKVIDGMKINVSQKPAVIKKNPVPSNPQFGSPSQPVVVQVSNLNPQRQVHEHWKCLTEAFSSYESAKVVDVVPPHAYISFASPGEAHSAAAALHESIIGGSTVELRIQQSQPEHQAEHQPLQARQPSTDAQETIELSSAQWNILTTVSSAGSSLYQELSQPFKTNPDVKVELLHEEVALQFTGKRDAVNAACGHFRTNLQRHIPIEL